MPQLILQPCVGDPSPRNVNRSLNNQVLLSELPLSQSERGEIEGATGSNAVWAWGCRGANPWKVMRKGDVVLFLTEKGRVTHQGVVAARLESEGVAEAIWTADSKGFKYIYFLSNVERCDLTRDAINQLLGKGGNWQGPRRVADPAAAARVLQELGFPVGNIEETPNQVESSRDWSEEELHAAVVEYLNMASRLRAGEREAKGQTYRALAERFQRTEGAFEYRMRNISYVLSLMGREWIDGLLPAKNVGSRSAAILERYILEVSGTVAAPRADEGVRVEKARRATKKVKPKGATIAKTVTLTSTTFVRDPDVKAWVLNRTKGKCEACLQPAPFTGNDGLPYLEVHHVRQLSSGGSDTTTNAVGICPNCHRRLHYSWDAHAYRESLFEMVSELVRE